jgi:hypothetical protein
MSGIRTKIVRFIDLFLVDSGMSASAFGRASCGDHHVVRNLREGVGVHLTKIEAMLAWIAAEKNRMAARREADAAS